MVTEQGSSVLMGTEQGRLSSGARPAVIRSSLPVSGQTISSSAPAMAPLIAEGSPTPFLNGARGCLGRSMPQLEDDASATNVRKEMEEEEKNILE